MARAKRKPDEAAADDGVVQTPETAAVSRWQDRLAAAGQAAEARNAEIQKNREYARGTAHDDGKPGLVRTNLIQVNMQTIVPHVYAKNPEIAVSPTAAVSRERYPVVRKFSETMEQVLQRMFVIDTQLKKRARSNLYSVMTTSEGWLKMVYQRDYAEDAIIKGRIQDSQDNLAALEKQLRDLRDPDQSSALEANRYELHQMLESLQQNVEVAVAEGLIIDRVLTDDMRILDDTLFDFDYYPYAGALAQRVWMTKDDYATQFGGWPEQGAPTLFQRPERSKQDTASTSVVNAKTKKQAQLVAVWEIWDKVDGNVKTLAEGAKRFAREPFTPEKRPQRWYPYYRMGWNYVDGDVRAIPDVSMQRELQDEYNTTRTNFADHRKASIPVKVVRTGGTVTQEDVDRIQNAKINQIIAIEGATTAALKDDLAVLDHTPIDPAVYDTSAIRTDMEMVSGRGDANAGTVQKAKTATEAELLQQGMASRSDFRRDVTEDLIQEMAQDAAEILLQELTLPQVQQISGEGAVWPEMSKDQIFNLVQIQIRAGSTSKPNRNKMIEQWQTLLPLMQNAIQQVFDLRSKGQFELATAVVKLLDETLKRFDERFDLEEFLGPQDEEGQAIQKQMAMMTQQNQQLQAELQQAQGELQKVDQQKQQAMEADIELKRMEIAQRSADRQMVQDRIAQTEQDKNARVMLEQQQEDKRAAAEAEMAAQDRAHEAGLAHAGMDHEATMQAGQQAHDQDMAAVNSKLAQMEQVMAAILAKLSQPEAEPQQSDTAEA